MISFHADRTYIDFCLYVFPFCFSISSNFLCWLFLRLLYVLVTLKQSLNFSGISSKLECSLHGGSSLLTCDSLKHDYQSDVFGRKPNLPLSGMIWDFVYSAISCNLLFYAVQYFFSVFMQDHSWALWALMLPISLDVSFDFIGILLWLVPFNVAQFNRADKCLFNICFTKLFIFLHTATKISDILRGIVLSSFLNFWCNQKRFTGAVQVAPMPVVIETHGETGAFLRFVDNTSKLNQKYG